MPLPLILGGVAIAAGLAGAKKGYDAYSANKEAGSVAVEAAHLFDTAKSRLEADKDGAVDKLADLGRLRLETWENDMGRFVSLFERIKDVELTGEVAKDSFARAVVTEAELVHLRDISFKAAEIVGGGVGALGSGALAGVAAYGGAMTFGAASTGTAIGSLTGVAATNATLAWFGGGSLAAGGMGMAGGLAVLGGLVTGPVLLVGGWALSAKADANLAKARANLAEARKAVAEMGTAGAALRSIARLAYQYTLVITRYRSTFGSIMDRLGEVIDEAGTSFPAYTKQQKETVWLAVEAASVMKKLLETSLLRPDGSVDPNSSAPLALPKVMVGKLEAQGAAHAGA
ncbi:hypothetical protein WI697_18845 [Tistrella mobilis]|uniref:hypothetical protein n=1 Tax=Tistrella mobilis TaxID=171437 RepID=UPI0031F6AA00